MLIYFHTSLLRIAMQRSTLGWMIPSLSLMTLENMKLLMIINGIERNLKMF